MRNSIFRPAWIIGAAAALAFGTPSALALGVKSVGSVEKGNVTQVTVVFDATVDPESAQTIGHYTLTGSTIQSATLINGLPAADASGNIDNRPLTGRVVDNQCVILTVNGVLNGAQTLTIEGVKGTDGSTLPSTVEQFTPSGYKWAEVGAPAKESKVIAIGTDGFDIYSNGRAMWNVYDEGVLVYKTETGDFDLQVRVEFQDTSSIWARAGAMIRDDLNEGEDRTVQTGNLDQGIEGTAARVVNLRANPVRAFNNDGTSPEFIAGNNSYESIAREITAGNYGGPGGGVPEYPNAWTRIQRTGETVTTFRSNDGLDWIEMSVLEGWGGNLFVGPAYFPETDNINSGLGEARSRLFLAQLRFNAITVPIVLNVQGTPTGFTFQIQDAANATLVPSSLKLTWNGTVVTPVIGSKNDKLTPISYSGPTIYPPGSSHTLEIEYQDSNNVTSQSSYNLETPNYATLPASYRLANATTRGINVSSYQIDRLNAIRGPGDANSVANAEQQWSRGFLDEAGNPWPNVAAPESGIVEVVNTLDVGSADGNFPDGQPTVGIWDPSYGQYVVQYWGYAQLQKGTYRMGVNSDDGFRVTFFSAAQDPFGTIVGEFNGGRGAADTLFDFVVEEDGFYPVRLLYWQGDGDASCEWFTVQPDGQYVLVNDPGNANSLKVFTTATGTAYVESMVPAQGYTGTEPAAQLTIVLRNGSTTVDTSSITFELDGTPVTPNISTANGATTVTYSPPSGFVFNSTHTGSFSYKVNGDSQARVIPLQFTVKGLSPSDLPADSFWIEAEDYNYESGQTLAEASVMPYLGGAYEGLPATLNVDYFNMDENDANNYRPDEAPNNVNMNPDLSGRYTNIRPVEVEMEVNYRIGWVADGDWCNYTRTIPPGTYNVFAALSFDGTAAGQLRGTLARVTSNPSQPNQTLQTLGTFNAPGSGGWGQNDLVPMKAADGTDGFVKITGSGPTTLRYTMASGDFDYLILAPATGIPPKITQATPNNTTVPRNQGRVIVEITDFTTAVDPASVKFIFDGVDRTAAATINKVADITSITYDPGGLPALATVSYSVEFKDTDGLVQTFNGGYHTSVLGTPGQFLIEAEDFNSNGATQPAASVMPYLGNAYAGLPGVNLVDFTSDGPADIPDDAQVYRARLTPVLPILANNVDLNRGLWTNTVNFRIGWADAADWGTYTRTFPEANYEVWAALSQGSDPPAAVAATLFEVTSDPTQPNQTTVRLGTFSGAGSGGWGNNILYPMVTDTGARTTVALGGTQTLRLQMGSGDFDYLMLIPSDVTPPPTVTINIDLAGDVIITFTGTLQATPSLGVNFTPVAGATSPYKVPPGSDQQYFRSSD